MRGFTPAMVLPLLVLLVASVEAEAGELRTISRNALVFVDATTDGGEWAAYRVVDERRPVIFRAEGPARVVLKVRTTVGKDAKPAVAAILNGERIVLTARIDPVRDPEARIVEGGGKAPSKPRVYVVRLEPGEHTVTIRYSEGAPLLVSATYLEGQDPTDVAAETDDGEVPLPSAIKKKPDGVQRIGKVTGEEGDGASEEQSPEEAATDRNGAVDGAARNRDASPDAKAGERHAIADPELWKNERPAEKSREEPEAPATIRPEYEPLPRAALEGRTMHPRAKRTLTVPAPWLSCEVRGGVMMSRLGLDPGPVVGVDVRLPLPLLDARTWTIGASLDASWARGADVVLSESERAPVDVAKISHASLQAGVDVRWTFHQIEGVLDPWVGAGVGVLAGSLGVENATGERTSSTFALLGLARLGAAFGALGSRPYFEVRLGAGPLTSDLARSSTGEAGYLEVDAVVGWRLELLTEAPAE